MHAGTDDSGAHIHTRWRNLCVAFDACAPAFTATAAITLYARQRKNHSEAKQKGTRKVVYDSNRNCCAR